jgi:hypothetical protein
MQLFNSFWWGGYECADHLNCFGDRVDYLTATGHLRRVDEDYALLAAHGIRTVREGIAWSQVEAYPGSYDFGAVLQLLLAGARHNVQQVWDLCHFGYPADLTPLHPQFARRFADLCRAFVVFYRHHRPEGPLLVTPIVEVTFISWLGGEVNGTAPFTEGQGWRTKYALMKAYIEGVRALKEADREVVVVACEPLTYTAPQLSSLSYPDATRNRMDAEAHDALQWQAMDMLTGRLCPELGGRPEYLNVLGLNYYVESQYELHGGPLDWEQYDARRLPLTTLVRRAHDRYQVPVVIAETGYWGCGHRRARWMREIAECCKTLLQYGLPLWGVCLYPLLDRINWDRPWEQCHQPGLWDTADPHNADSERVLCEPLAQAFAEAREMIATAVPQVV